VDYVLHHPKYYLPGGDLYVLVSHFTFVVFVNSLTLPGTQINGTMFRIHSFFFNRESAFFRDVSASMDAVGSAEENEEKGKSEDRAIRVLDVTVEEFERFLWVFYNPCGIPPT
jgi:hypothetical protein